MKPYIKAHVNMDGSKVVAHCAGISGGKIQEMGQDIVAEAQKNMRALEFKESTGAAAREIHYTKTGAMSCEVAASSGHTTFIEWGSQFIEEKRAIIWPAYRAIKKALFKGKKWL